MQRNGRGTGLSTLERGGALDEDLEFTDFVKVAEETMRAALPDWYDVALTIGGGAAVWGWRDKVVMLYDRSHSGVAFTFELATADIFRRRDAADHAELSPDVSETIERLDTLMEREDAEDFGKCELADYFLNQRISRR
jgi:hypothetical protein